MPVTLVDRMPLPNLKVYTAGSVVLLSIAVYYAVEVTGDPSWRLNASSLSEEEELLQLSLADRAHDTAVYMLHEPLCMWSVINMCYCLLALAAAGVQRVVFGALRAGEAVRLKERLWNYVFYKFMFVFGVVNVQYLDEVLLWAGWFSALGLLQLSAHLAKDRYDYLCQSGTSAGRGRVLALLGAVLAAAVAAAGLAARLTLPAHKDVFTFMAAECVVAGTLSLPGLGAGLGVSRRGALVLDGLPLLAELAGVALQVCRAQLALSLASLVLLLQLRHLLSRLRRRLQLHERRSRLMDHLDRSYPMASKAEVLGDQCAICWEPLAEARKLPCAHCFHNECLSEWVWQDASCPTCRRALAPGPPRDVTPPLPPAPLHLFHFDGSRYVWWLPSFSVEVTRGRADVAEHVDDMARQVQQMFPSMPLWALAADLTVTRSVDLTVENILDGRLRHDATPDATHDDTRDAPPPPDEQWAAEAGEEGEEGGFPSSPWSRERQLAARRRRLLATARERYLARST